MGNHTDGFIPFSAREILVLLNGDTPPQFYRSGDWPDLFTPCGCCPMSERGYEPITAEQARGWAEERVDD
jgi:hypothetical protein